MRILIAAGGTGGHIYPGIAIAQQLKKKNPGNQILFIGSKNGLEKKILSAYQFDLKFISVRGLQRKISWKAILAFLYFPWSLIQSFFLIFFYKPQVVVLTGGYVSLPVALVARLLKIPTVLHEQNVLPGLTNRIISCFVNRIALSWQESQPYFRQKNKLLVTGNPLRVQFLETSRKAGLTKLSLKDGIKTILVLGGSQGAKKLNETVYSLILKLQGNLSFQIVHICGERDYPSLKSNTAELSEKYYKLISYMPDIWNAYACADLAVSRAGALALSELLCCKVPAILIPFPFSAEGHQDLNAKVLERAGAAIVMSNDELSADTLLSIISKLLADEEKLNSMKAAAAKLAKRQAAETITEIIYDLI